MLNYIRNLVNKKYYNLDKIIKKYNQKLNQHTCQRK